MDLKGRKSINKAVLMWAVVALLLLIMATPALSTLFAEPGSVNTKAIVDGAVTSKKIKNGTIKNGDIAVNAAIAASKINTSGTLTAGNYAYKSVKTGRLAIPGSALFPTESNMSYFTYGGSRYSSVAEVTEFVAPVYLPHGANITSFTARVYDNSANNETVSLHRVTGPDAFSSIAEVSTLGTNPAWMVLPPDTSISSNPVDTNYAYFVKVRLFGSGYNLMFDTIYITYTYTTPGS